MYRKGNKTKIITSLVLVLVLGLSLGFAAFTNTLKITPQATITPDSATFDIDFSSKYLNFETNDITPILEGTGLTAEAAEIDNSTNPTISNLKVNFTKPGQSATYSFYAYNNGEYLAYLNSINFLNPEGKDAFITCEAVESTTQYVEEACKGIKVNIIVGATSSNNVTTLSTDVSLSNITGHSLPKAKAESVVVEIEYLEGSAVADGAFNVNIGDITLVYTTLDNTVVTEQSIQVASSPTHKLHIDDNVFLIDQNTTWQDCLDASDGLLQISTDSGPEGEYLKIYINGKGGMLYFGYPGSLSWPPASSLSDKIISSLSARGDLYLTLGNCINDESGSGTSLEYIMQHAEEYDVLVGYIEEI